MENGHDSDTPCFRADTVNPDGHTIDDPNTRGEPDRLTTDPNRAVAPPTRTRTAAPAGLPDTSTSAKVARGAHQPPDAATSEESTGTHAPPRRTRTGEP